jgi:hypothetical protein
VTRPCDIIPCNKNDTSIGSTYIDSQSESKRCVIRYNLWRKKCGVSATPTEPKFWPTLEFYFTLPLLSLKYKRHLCICNQCKDMDSSASAISFTEGVLGAPSVKEIATSVQRPYGCRKLNL